MTDNKKEQERAELHKTIWGIANDLRGSVDGWDFKQYVLGILFYPLLVNDPRFSLAGVLAPKFYAELTEHEYLSKIVPNSEVEKQDYNLSVSTYVEQKDTREVIDIIELNAEIKEIVAREQVLRDEIDKIIAKIEVD